MPRLEYPLKALTLRHPWPWAIVELGKDVENRSWRPPAWLVGKWFAIHGGKEPSGPDRVRTNACAADILHDLRMHYMAGEVTLSSVVRPGVVAVVRLAKVVGQSPSRWFEGPYGWVLSEPWIVPDPPQLPGKQGLWDVPGEVAAELERQGAPWAK